MIFWSVRTQSRLLFTGNSHLLDQHRASSHTAAQINVAADGDNLLIHLLQVAGDCDFVNRIGNLSVFDPKARSAARVITRHSVHTLTHEFRDDETAMHLL